VSLLLINLSFDDIKESLVLNCWSLFNRQKYLIINAYFIDHQLIYHEMLLAFEHVTDSHIEQRLVKILHNVIVKYELQEGIMFVTSDNARNNKTMHSKLDRMLRTMLRTNHLLFYVKLNISKIERVSCLTYIIQLILQSLFEHIRISSKNAELQINWNNK
jgi:hypothetical protein